MKRSEKDGLNKDDMPIGGIYMAQDIFSLLYFDFWDSLQSSFNGKS